MDCPWLSGAPNSAATTSILQVDSQGNPIFTPQGSPIAVDPSRAGPATLQPGTLTTTNGFSVTAYQNLSNNMAWNCDCHGYTVANGQFWIDNGDMQSLLATQTYLAQTPVVTQDSTSQVGDWVVYSDSSGNVVHSGVLTSPGQLTMAAGTVIYPGPSKTTTVPVNQGWPGATIQYWTPNP